MNIYFYIFNLNVYIFMFYFKDEIAENGIYYTNKLVNKIMLLFEYKISNKLPSINVIQI